MKDGVLNVFSKFTGIHLCWSLQSCRSVACNFVKKRLRHRCVFVDLWNFDERLFLWSTSLAASGCYKFCKLIWKSFLIRTIHWLPTQKKVERSKVLTLPPCKYSTLNFSLYSLSPIHAYTKWFIVKKIHLCLLHLS